MQSDRIEKTVWAIAGAAAGTLLTIFLAAPWLTPLADSVVNAIAAVSTAVAAVGGAYLLWKYQVHAREQRLKCSIATVFDALLEDMNMARLTLSDQGAKELLLAQDVTTMSLERYIEITRPFRLHYLSHTAQMAIDLINSIQDAVAGLATKDVEIFLELYQMAKETVRRMPGFEDELNKSTNQSLSRSSLHVFDHAVGALAHQLNRLDGGNRNDSMYLEQKPSFDAVKKRSAELYSTVFTQQAPIPPAFRAPVESPTQPSPDNAY
ncbi:hypothetical protein ACTT2I_05280 [Stenotrophomonas sp. PUT21]|uniref:hypothetical protein n=1 Tax=Stenotrophomonas sp. PUT21 TaxID=3456954 RepID=UPI003FCE5CFD